LAEETRWRRMDLEESRGVERAEAARARDSSVGDGFGGGLEGVEMGRKEERKEGKGTNRILRLRPTRSKMVRRV